MKKWTMQNIADELEISLNTLRNWHKNESFSIFKDDSFCFPIGREQKNRLIQEVSESSRLKYRANRLGSVKSHKRDFENLRLSLLSISEQRENIVFSFLSRHKEELNLTDEQKILIERELEDMKRDYPCIMSFIDENRSGKDNPGHLMNSSLYRKVLRRSPEDPAGEILQLLENPGHIVKSGRFFTPFHIIDEIFELNPWIMKLNPVVDPAAGSGRFIISYLKKGGDPAAVYGIEKDRINWRLARINYVLYSDKIPGTIPVYHLDSLTDKKSIDLLSDAALIITNPPWGTLNSTRGKQYTPEKIWKGDLFSMFIHSAWKNLPEGGRFLYILPQSILMHKKHSPVRRKLMEKGSIEQVRLWRRKIKGVQSDIMSLLWEKGRYGNPVEIVKGKEAYERKDINGVSPEWDLHMSPEDKIIERKIYDKSSRTVSDMDPVWLLGIVTGDNKNRLSTEAENKKDIVIRGRDIFRDRISDSGLYLTARGSEIQQMAPEHLYRAPCKIVYRFISKVPVASLDRSGRFLLNSSNALILESEEDMSLLVNLLNSRLYRYLFYRKYNSIKVLRSHLESLPFPVFSRSECREIEEITKADCKEKYENLFIWLCSYFELKEKEIDYVSKRSSSLPDW